MCGVVLSRLQLTGKSTAAVGKPLAGGPQQLPESDRGAGAAAAAWSVVVRMNKYHGKYHEITFYTELCVFEAQQYSALRK